MTTVGPVEAGPADQEGPVGLCEELRVLWADARAGRPRAKAAAAAVAVMLVAGVALRFYCPSALWLDETISVNISRLPLLRIPGALAHDGAPPLYYYLLHFWMLVFGRGDLAVRAMSGVISVGTIPLFWRAGWRLGGRRVAWATLVLGVTSPFAIEYAATTRMYSLMILWSLLGYLALTTALHSPTRRNLVAVGAVTAALLYTHYWALYMIGVVGVWLVWRIRGDSRGRPIGESQRGVRPVFGAVVVGSLLWLPWSPVFVFQALHTGTPWTSAASPSDLLGVFSDFGGSGPWGVLLAYCLFALTALGVFGRRLAPGDDRRGRGGVLLVLRPSPRVAALIGVTAGTLVVAVAAGAAANAAFVARYAAIVLPLLLLVVAVGTSLFERRVAAAILAVMALAGLLTGIGQNSSPRTQAVQVAAVLNAQAQPGDLVVFCPDQLGPAVNRLLTVPDVTQLTFPRAIGPERVDWVDYTSVIDATHVDLFAQEMLSRLGPGHTLWLVYKDGYPGLGSDCGYLRSWLDLYRPTGVTAVAANPRYYESDNLVRYPS